MNEHMNGAKQGNAGTLFNVAVEKAVPSQSSSFLFFPFMHQTEEAKRDHGGEHSCVCALGHATCKLDLFLVDALGPFYSSVFGCSVQC